MVDWKLCKYQVQSSCGFLIKFPRSDQSFLNHFVFFDNPFWISYRNNPQPASQWPSQWPSDPASQPAMSHFPAVSILYALPIWSIDTRPLIVTCSNIIPSQPPTQPPTQPTTQPPTTPRSLTNQPSSDQLWIHLDGYTNTPLPSNRIDQLLHVSGGDGFTVVKQFLQNGSAIKQFVNSPKSTTQYMIVLCSNNTTSIRHRGLFSGPMCRDLTRVELVVEKRIGSGELVVDLGQLSHPISNLRSLKPILNTNDNVS